jgi:ectoine hydroxylase-related dioxygenase (phytanoyl-CoA dioxygenase family)
MRQVRLSEADLAQFDSQGFLRLPGVLDATEIESLLAGVAKLQSGGEETADSGAWWENFQAGTQPPSSAESREFRNVARSGRLFEDLVDAPSILMPIAQILGPRIGLLMSHAVIRAPVSGLTMEELGRTELGWHRDLGSSYIELPHPQPRLSVKAALWLTPLTGPGQGAMRVIPGSNRLAGDPAIDPDSHQPHGSIDVLADPGDILLFEQRLWHAACPNALGSARVSLFYAYGYRWLRPQDYSDLRPERLSGMSPVRRQLFGAKASTMGYHLPTPDDIPLEACFKDWLTSTNEPVSVPL